MITTDTKTGPEGAGRTSEDDGDPVLDALEALDQVLAGHAERAALMRRRIVRVTAERRAGRPYRDIVDGTRPPRLLEIVTAATRDLEAAGAELRRAEAQALHDEGLTMDEIAERFGVTRQRISAVLRRAG
jgi:hypothetical protein